MDTKELYAEYGKLIIQQKLINSRVMQLEQAIVKEEQSKAKFENEDDDGKAEE